MHADGGCASRHLCAHAIWRRLCESFGRGLETWLAGNWRGMLRLYGVRLVRQIWEWRGVPRRGRVWSSVAWIGRVGRGLARYGPPWAGRRQRDKNKD